MTIKKPADLIRFVSNIPALEDGSIPLNRVAGSDEFVSGLYEPTYSLSVLARLTQEALVSGKIEVTSDEMDPRTLVMVALNSDLASYAPNVYLLLRAVALELFSLLYHIEEESGNLQYVSLKDFLRTKENINYLTDFLGTEDKYRHMIEVLRQVHISLGYLQNQTDVIMNNKGVR